AAEVHADERTIIEKLIGGKINELLPIAEVRDIFWKVGVKNILRALLVRPIDAHLNIQAARAHDRRIDEFISVRGANDDDIVKLFYAIELRYKLRNNGCFHDRRHA